METTCVLIKPDAMKARRIGEIIARFEKAGLEVTSCKMLVLTSEMLNQHYEHLLEKPFYGELEEFMQSGPVMALALAGPDAVVTVRNLAGPTNPSKADPGTIRADFGTDVMLNAVHASDAPEAAEAELTRFGLR
jgi:nucleoside-diphosphate kinase